MDDEDGRRVEVDLDSMLLFQAGISAADYFFTAVMYRDMHRTYAKIGGIGNAILGIIYPFIPRNTIAGHFAPEHLQ